MSFHHQNRLYAHLDLATLSPEQRLVAIALASSINTRWLSFSPSPEQLIRNTGINDSEQVMALAAELVDLGIFRVQPLRSDPSRLSFVFAITCPADCSNKSHSTPKERSLWGSVEPDLPQIAKTKVSQFPIEKMSIEKRVEPIEKMSIEKRVEPIENEALDREMIWGLVSRLEPEIREIYLSNIEEALSEAKQLIDTHKPGHHKSYLAAVLADNPRKLLKSKPDPEAFEYEERQLTEETLRLEMIDLFSQLGIDYTEEIEPTTLLRKLRPAYFAGKLDLSKCWTIYNESQPQDKRIPLPDSINIL